MILRLLNLSRKLSKSITQRFSEEDKSKSAIFSSALESFTVFDKIILKELSADIIYEDNKCLAFTDINPQAKVHLLLIPKKRIARLEDVTEGDCDLLGHIMKVAGDLGKKHSAEGFRIVINNGFHGCQSVLHLHLHIIGGQQLRWPPGV